MHIISTTRQQSPTSTAADTGGLLGGATPLVHLRVTVPTYARLPCADVWVVAAAAYAAPPGTVSFADRISPGMHLSDTVLLIPNYDYRESQRPQQRPPPTSQVSVAPRECRTAGPVSPGSSEPTAPGGDSSEEPWRADYGMHLAAVGEAVRLTIEAVGATSRAVGLAVQLALSLSSTCSYMRRVCDSDPLWHTLFLSHQDAPAVSISQPTYSGGGLWKTLYKAFCALIYISEEQRFIRPHNFSVSWKAIKSWTPSSYNVGNSTMTSTNTPPCCHFDCPGRTVTRKPNRRVILHSKGKRFWNITFEYGPPECHRAPIVRHERNTGTQKLECFLNDAEWVDIHVDGKSYLLHSPKRFRVDFKLVYVSPESTIKVIANATVRHLHTGMATPVRIDDPLEVTCFIEYTIGDRNSITQEYHLNFQNRFLSRIVPLPEGPIRRATIIKVTGPENIEASVGSTLELNYTIPVLISPPGKSFSFQIGSEPPCDTPPKVEIRSCESGGTIPFQGGPSSSYVTRWDYSSLLNVALVGTEVEVFAKYGPEKHSLFKSVVPYVIAEQTIIDNHQQVLFFLRLSNWSGRCIGPQEVDAVLMSRSGAETVQWLQCPSGSIWNAVCIVTSVPPGLYSVEISTKMNDAVILEFPVDVVQKEPPVRSTWIRPGTTTCHICGRVVNTGSSWSCKQCEYDLCDKCHSNCAELHPHPLQQHRFKVIRSDFSCDVCGVKLAGGYSVTDRQQDIDYCLKCIPPSLDASSFCLYHW
ncbi:hypothetical protein Pelo_6793 [Pelomyxa schiedti]|nr:hypothetical protein Pelo_6793 [Pelomyxa schiedti]